MRSISTIDMDFIANSNPGLWADLRQARIFLTGGTGFYGTWLVESFCAIQDRFQLDASLHVLTRDPDSFKKKLPVLKNRGDIFYVTGDVRSFTFPAGDFSHVIHAATPASATLKVGDPINMFTTIVDGTKRVLEFARESGVRKFLLASSGAVYGPQPPHVSHLPESFLGGPDPLADNSSYGEGKRASECLAGMYSRVYGIDVKIARGFAFVGPHLPLDGTYAVGNFINDGLNGKDIQVGGDGTPYRSYLYAADLTLWLWTILIKGKTLMVYNVGSDEAVSIADLAREVAEVCGVDVSISKTAVPGAPIQRYIPDISRAKNELGLNVSFGLRDAIKRTVAWHRNG